MSATKTPLLTNYHRHQRSTSLPALPPPTFSQALATAFNLSILLTMKPFVGIRQLLQTLLPFLPSNPRTAAATLSSNSDREEMKAMFKNGDDYQAQAQAQASTEVPITAGMYTVSKKIGSGSFGSVYICKHRCTGELYAGKLFKPSFVKDKENLNMLYSEVEVLKRLSHKNTISFIELVFSRHGALIVMDLVNGKNVHDMVANVGLVESFARVVFLQLMQAIQYLHSLRIVHRDIKVDNVMIDDRGIAKLVDFGLAEAVPKERAEKDGLIITGVCGTKAYYSPELIRCKVNKSTEEEFAGDKIDIWAAGVFLYELVSGRRLFRGSFSKELFEDVHSLNWLRFEKGDDNFSSELMDLLRSILKIEPSERPSIEEILVHPWSQGSSFDVFGSNMITSPSGKVQVSLVGGTPEKGASCPHILLPCERPVQPPLKFSSCRELNGWRSEVSSITSNSDEDSCTFSSLGRPDLYSSSGCGSSTTFGDKITARKRGRWVLLNWVCAVHSMIEHLHYVLNGKITRRKLHREDVEQVW